jgi:hypothetical protein
MGQQEAAPNIDEVLIICSRPDFCFKDHRVVAYEIIVRGGADDACSRNVNVTGAEACHIGQRLPLVQGNEPATAGVRSGVVQGYARPSADPKTNNAAPNVNVNGKPMIRHGTEYEMNANGPNGQHNTTGKLVYKQQRDGECWGIASLNQKDPDCKDIMDARGRALTAHARSRLAPLEAYTKFGVKVGGEVTREQVDDKVGLFKLAFYTLQMGADEKWGSHFPSKTEYALLPSSTRHWRRVAQAAEAWENASWGAVYESQLGDIHKLFAEGDYVTAVPRSFGRLTTLISPHMWTKSLKIIAKEAGKKALTEVPEAVVDTAEQSLEDAGKKKDPAKQPGVVINKK